MTSLWVILALAFIHAAAGTTTTLHLRWRTRVLSAAAGVSVAYVFLDQLPSLARGQQLIDASGLLSGLESHVFILSLLGFTVAFWVETAARRSREDRRSVGGADQTGDGPFRLAVASFLIYNAAIGYAVAHPADEAIAPLWLFALAMGLHFAVNDHSLVEHHGARYQTWGRWLLVAGLLGGWILGVIPALVIPAEALALVLAYVAGGVIMNILRHELPASDRTGDVLAFAAGAAVYGSLVLLLSPAA